MSREKKSKEHTVTKAEVVWFKLFPIDIGDEVIVRRTGKRGMVGGMNVPMFHIKGKDPSVFWYEKSDYIVHFKGDKVRSYKRWELRKA